MHIETLKVFCDIIESGSFSYAASQNFVTQSAVSQQVRSLEEKYDCRLIERGRAGVKPTPAGQILYNSSKEIVRRFMELENRLREIGSVVAGSIRVGTVYSVGLHELPPYLTEFLRNYPAVNVHLEYLRSNKIYEDLVEGKIDLGVVAYPAKRSQIVSIAFRHDELVLVVPPDSLLIMPECDRHYLAALGGIRHHAQIDFAFNQVLVNFVRAQVFEVDVDGRIVAQKLGQVGRELVQSDTVHGANPNRACHHRPDLAQAIFQLHEPAHDL